MTMQELKAQLDQQVANGQLTEEEALTILARFAVTGNAEEGQQLSVDRPLQEQMALSQQQAPVAPVVSNPDTATQQDLKRIVSASEQGANVNNDVIAQAQAQLEERARIQGMSFLETLSDPAALARMGQTALKAPASMVNGMVNAIPGLAGKAVGADDFSKRNLEEFSKTNQNINDLFGVSDPITPLESLAENATSALVPGGVAVKAASVGADFMIDQAVREMTTVDEGYNTVFDKLGLSDQDKTLGLSPLVALPFAIVAGVGAGKAINNLRNTTVVSAPTIKNVNDFDKFAPDDLKTLETSGDAAMAYVVDEVGALERILNRAGVPNMEEVSKKLSLNSHASANVRAREAVNTGKLVVNGRRYQAPVSVRQLYEAAMALPTEARASLERYLNAKDALDDVRIAMAKNLPGNHAAIESRLLSEIARAAARTPRGIIRQFEAAYQSATQAARDFLEGDLLDTASKQWLDANRRHYVPLDVSPVDPTAPFMDRLIQAGREGQINPDDWFLKNRAGAGGYDLDMRGSPFEVLVGYTESAMRAAMKNDAKLATIDGLLNSQYGKETIRLVNDTDDLAGNANRIVEVYRGGKKERYITSQLQAQLMQFDPYIAQHPTMFMIKRIQEWNMVGPGSVVFAPVTAIRDTIAGAVLRPEGAVSAGPLQVAAAVPKQLWAKAQNALAMNITAGLVSNKQLIPQSIWSNSDRAALAQKLSNNYVNSLYHLANEAGGFDGSIMRNNIVAAQNTLGEIRRTLRDSSVLKNRATDSLIGRLGIKGAEGFIDGFVALFDAVQNAPRYAALENTIKSGKQVDDAVGLARSLTGDVSRGGRYYTPEGRGMMADTVDRGVTSLITPKVGQTAAFLRESTPFFNPMIQGTRRLIDSFKTDPVGTMQRAWLNVGLPAFAAYSWNEMIGQEYNDYAMSRRSAYDTAMNIYIGLPGLPPEMGIEIPLPHELLMFNSPFTRMLHGLAEGEHRDEKAAAMGQLAKTLLQNSVEVAAPAFVGPLFNAAGITSPGGMFSYDQGVYEIQEDYVGALPQNMEQLIRTMFSANGDIAIQVAYAMAADGEVQPFNTFLTEVTQSISKRLVVVKNVTGNKTANVSYSMPAEYDRAKAAAMEEVYQYLLPEERENEDGIMKPQANLKGYGNAKGAVDESRDLPFAMPGPSARNEAVNPLVKQFGAQLLDVARRNEVGLGGLNDRDAKYRSYIRQLKQYNSGHSEAIAEWQSVLQDIDAQSEDTKELREMLNNFDIDLTSYAGRVKLINIIENERSYIIRQKLELFETVEDNMSAELQELGMLPPGERFRIEKHLKPDDPNPFGQ